MKQTFFLFITLILIFYCSSKIENDKKQVSIDYVEPWQTDILKHEMTFGGEESGIDNEFLLVSPMWLNVNNNGDIILSDENCIKVYDKFGKGKKIIGRSGQGPGEFESKPQVSIGPTGYIMAITEPRGTVTRNIFYNLFGPDYKLIEKKRFLNKPRLQDYLEGKKIKIKNIRNLTRAIPISGTEIIYRLIYENEEETASYTSLIYESDDTLFEIVNVKTPGTITTPNFRLFAAQALGTFYWELLPNKRVAYINSDEDKHDDVFGSSYTVHVCYLDGREEYQITQKFNPIEFPEDLVNFLDISEYTRPQKSLLINAYKDKKYYASMKRMYCDLQYIFVSIHTLNDLPLKQDASFNETIASWETQLDVFDLNIGKYIGSFKFPSEMYEIEGGYAFNVDLDKYGFMEIRKYKINPIVYGLPEDPDWKTKK